jgi:hypothetical protein
LRIYGRLEEVWQGWELKWYTVSMADLTCILKEKNVSLLMLVCEKQTNKQTSQRGRVDIQE